MNGKRLNLFYTIFFFVDIYNSKSQVLNQFWENDIKINSVHRMGKEFDVSNCNLPKDQKENIQSYREIVRNIFDLTTHGLFSGKTYKDLENLVDSFGSRISGSESLQKSIAYMRDKMIENGFVNVHQENAAVPKWQRGEEEALLIAPRTQKLRVMAHGLSIGTSKAGIIAEVVVLDSMEALQNIKENLTEKIVVFNTNQPMSALFGANTVAKLGASACLIRTSTPFSLYTSHAGLQFYDTTIPRIPIGSLTTEDSSLLGRLAAKGAKLKMFLKLEILANEMAESFNVVGDFVGNVKPDNYVVLSGHMDSWDVGQGAVDDGVGSILALEVTNVLKHLNLIPRRTIRSILFTGEEFGLYGARQWARDHKLEMNQYSAALESDYGCFKPMGFIFTGKPDIGCVLHEIRSLMSPTINLTSLTRATFMPTDIAALSFSGVPSVVLNGNDGKYFWYHHTDADVLTAMESSELDKCLAVWSSLAFIVADMQISFPFG